MQAGERGAKRQQRHDFFHAAAAARESFAELVAGRRQGTAARRRGAERGAARVSAQGQAARYASAVTVAIAAQSCMTWRAHGIPPPSRPAPRSHRLAGHAFSRRAGRPRCAARAKAYAIS